MNGGNSSSVMNSNNMTMLNFIITFLYTLSQKFNTPFADYGSVQYFVEKVKYLERNICNNTKKMSFLVKIYIIQILLG